ncbi:MAG: TrmH family RNA methyltransferase [Legionella sp.]|uniref:tRNA (cytidine(34)-2'-O)-methyltransferase n=1 Tax=Legionella sp. TaxID=459 RepID=UPI0039E44F04
MDEHWENFIAQHHQKRIFACSAHAKTCYTQEHYTTEDMFLFGPESNGLPKEIVQTYNSIYIPMRENNRSLNLANAVVVILYEAWRQLDFS